MRGLLVRLRALLRPAAEHAEADEELRYHLDRETARYTAQGLSPEAARTEALRAMGGLEQHKDAMREARGVGFLEHAARDVMHASRALRRMPRMSLVVVLSLALGIGANATIFSWVQLVLLAPLPGVRDAAQLQLVEATGENGGYPGSSWLEYRDLRQRATAFDDLLAFKMAPMNVGEASHNERVFGLLVSDNYFRALSLSPAAGRLLDSTDFAPGSGTPVVVSHEFWRTRLGAAPDAAGRTVLVNGAELIVVGVTPEGFQGTALGLDFSLFLPASLAPVVFAGSRELDDRNQRGYHVMGRLRQGAGRDDAARQVAGVFTELAELYPEGSAGMRGEVLAFWNAPNGPQRMMARGLVVLQAILLVLLLAVCGNTANLMLARASARQREMAARLALGATRWRVISLVLAENMLLATAGAAIGALLAAWGTTALRALPMTGAFPIRLQTHVDGLTIGFVVLLALLCGLAFGLAPALSLAGTDPQRALRAGFGAPARGRLRGVLIGAEVALAITVLAAAAMLFRSFRETRTDSGFRQAGILLTGYDFSTSDPPRDAVIQFTDRLLRDLRALPGVEGVAVSGQVPLDIHGLPLRAFSLEGRARDDGTTDRALMNVVTPGYFGVMDIALEAGSDFVALTDAVSGPQVVVNTEFVRRYIGAGEPLGRRLTAGQTTYTIAGVVRGSLYDAFGEPPRPIIYYSYRDRPWATGQIHVRTREGAERTLAPAVEQAVRRIDPALPVYDVRTMVEHVDKNLFLRKIPARLFVVLGPLLLVLAAIGMYAVVDYAVSLRSHEIGLRLALGAGRGRVVRQMMAGTLRAVGYGSAAGMVVVLLYAMHATRGAISAPIFLGVPLLMFAVSALACWLPARRAALLDPMVALRRE